MRAAVILFPGVNREGDVARALRQATGAEPAIVWHAERELPPGLDLVVLPGGFSYGDYLRCGAIAARAPIMRAVGDHAARGGLVLGICNGFQILCEAGLLPGVLMRNAQLPLRLQNAACAGRERANAVHASLRAGTGGQVRHRAWRGKLRRRRRRRIRRIEAEGRVAFRYCDAEGGVGDASNPNGAINSIAGVFNDRFNVLGFDAASGKPDRPPGRRRGRTRAFRRPCGMNGFARELIGLGVRLKRSAYE